MERQLGGGADDLLRLLRILLAGEFDDDAILAGPGQGGLGDTEGVDAAAQDLQRTVGRFGVGRDRFGALRFVRELCATGQVEPEGGGVGEGGVDRNDNDEQRRDGAPEGRLGS